MDCFSTFAHYVGQREELKPRKCVRMAQMNAQLSRQQRLV